MVKRLLYFMFALFAAIGAGFAVKMLPFDNTGLVAEKYSGWSGVLRIHVAGGWAEDSATGWLNACASEFEKSHNGVYVQITPVERLDSLSARGLRAPDGILFAPGELNSADGLVPLTENFPVRENLRTSYYAVPVAMSGYGWAVREEGETVAIPADDAFHSWSAAALSLSTGQAEILPEEIELPGVDLGLPAIAQGAPSIMEESDSALSDFISGNARAVPVTSREIAILKSRNEQGRGPDWSIDVLSEYTFTDQLLLYAVPACEDEDADARRALSVEFLNCLLGDECQTALSKRNLIPVTDAPSTYAATDPMASLDLISRTENVITPPVFGSDWRADARAALAEYTTGEYTADEAFRRLFGFS